MEDQVTIQVQSETGNWTNCNTIYGLNYQLIRSAMEQVRSQYPNSRVRAVNQSGSLIDML